MKKSLGSKDLISNEDSLTPFLFAIIIAALLLSIMVTYCFNNDHDYEFQNHSEIKR